MRILWHSNAPWVQTGYGVQTALFAPRLRALGHQVAISAFWGLGGSRMEWEEIPVFPADENWGNRLLGPYASFWGEGDLRACQVITLMDVWVLKNHATFRKLRMASWVPVDHDPVPVIVLSYFKASGARPIAMSRYGQRKLEELGLEPLYVPHGVDTTIFRPYPDRAAIREALGIPSSAFLVGMVANNKGQSPARKGFPEAFEAFARFLRKRPDAILYLHTEKRGVRQGLDLVTLASMLGIPDDSIRWAPQLELELGIEPEALAQIYSAMDVLLNPSYGEGFGVPIVEAQACGTPVLVGDNSAQSELCGAGWKIRGEKLYDGSQGAYFSHPSVESIIEGLHRAYNGAAKRGLRERARRFAEGYDADRVATDHWAPALEELEQAAEGSEILEALA